LTKPAFGFPRVEGQSAPAITGHQPLTAFTQQGYLLAFLAVLAGWVILALPWLLGRVTIPYDATAHFYPQLQFLARALHSGDSPFWTPNVFAGSPQIADPQSLIFSPAFLLAYFNPAPSLRAFDTYVFVVILAGCFSILALFRDRGWHPAAGVLAALAFGFGASANARIQHVSQIHGLVFFMIALWLLARALDRRSLVYGALAGVAAGAMAVAPGQVQLLGCYILAGYVVWHWLSAEDVRRAIMRSAPPLAAAGTVAIALAGLPLLLTFLFGHEASRAEIPFAHVEPGSLHPASLLTAFIADLFGANDLSVPYWGPGSSGWVAHSGLLAQNMGQIYIGILPMLALLAFGFVKQRLWRHEVRFFTVALGFSLVYALGAYTPMFRIFYEILPGVQQFRRPSDATFLIGAFMAIVGGYCLHVFLTEEERPSHRRYMWVAGALAAIVCLAFIAAAYQGKVAAAIKPIVLAAFFAAAAGAVLVALGRMREASPAVAIVLVTGLMVADLGVNNRTNESTALAAERYAAFLPSSNNQTAAFLRSKLVPTPTDRRDRVALLGIGFDWPNAGLTHGFDHIYGYNPLRLHQIDEVIGTGDTVAVPDQVRFTPLMPSYRSTMADMLGLRYIVSPVPIEKIDKALRPGDLKPVGRTQEGFLYENPGALPRVMVVSDFRLVDFAALTKTGRWPTSFDPRSTVLLETPALRASAAAAAPPRSGPSSARLLSYRNTQIEVDVDAEKPGFLVLNDVWHPWWFAQVDGKDTPILRANVLFRAVPVAAGRHRVRFTFRPLVGAMTQLEHFPVKWTPVYAAKMRPSKEIEPRSGSMGTEKALARGLSGTQKKASTSLAAARPPL
jgi:hypothetical protein